jgi:non-specific protein-tyrosine kinase
MDARRSLAIFRRWLWLLVASALLAGGAAFLVSNALTKLYEAKVVLIVGQSLQSVSPDYNQLLASQRLSQTYADLATTGSLLAQVIDVEGLDLSVTTLREQVKADAPQNSTLVTITVTNPDPAKVAAIANTFAAQLIAASPAVAGRNSSVQQFVDRDLGSIQTQIDATQTEVERLVGLQFRTQADEDKLQALQGRLVSLRSTYATLLQYSSTSGSNLLTVVDPATAPSEPSSPRVLVNAAVAVLLGILLAIGAAYFIEYLDDTLKSPGHVEAATGLPTLGAIMLMKGDKKRAEIYRLVSILYPRSQAAEAFRTLRTNIEFASLDTPARTILVTSAIPGEGKTTTASNLAAVFAQAGHATILVDVDMRKPGVHKVFDLPNTLGLTQLLRSDDTSVQDVAQKTEQENLTVITTGPLPPNPAELIRSARMRAVISRLAEAADFVIFDSPPLQAVTDAAILSSEVDGTVLVVDSSRTRSGAAANGRDALSRVGANVLGVVLNRLTKSTADDYYYYNYYGSYSTYGAYGAYGAEGKESPRKAAGPKAAKDS